MADDQAKRRNHEHVRLNTLKALSLLHGQEPIFGNVALGVRVVVSEVSFRRGVLKWVVSEDQTKQLEPKDEEVAGFGFSGSKKDCCCYF